MCTSPLYLAISLVTGLKKADPPSWKYQCSIASEIFPHAECAIDVIYMEQLKCYARFPRMCVGNRISSLL